MQIIWNADALKESFYLSAICVFMPHFTHVQILSAGLAGLACGQ